jgi:hypothetical protein
MKKLILHLSSFILVLSSSAAPWTNYPYATTFLPSDTFLIGTTNTSRTNQQVSGQALLDQTRTNVTAICPTNGGPATVSVLTNANGLVWWTVATNAVPSYVTAPNGSICTTTNGQLYVRSNAVWNLK